MDFFEQYLPPPTVGTEGGQALWELANEVLDAQAQNRALDIDRIVAAFRSWYQAEVKPQLLSATAAAQFEPAISTWRFWLGKLNSFLLGTSAEVYAALEQEIGESVRLAAAAFVSEIDRRLQVCSQDTDPLSILPVMVLQANAAAWGLDLAEEVLAKDWVLVGVLACVELQ